MEPSSEDTNQFVERKSDHIRLSLKAKNTAEGGSGFERVELIHEALPDLDFSEVSLSSSILGLSTRAPFLISSMTAGHEGAGPINVTLAEAAQARGWLMGVGSQRRQLSDPEAAGEWKQLRKSAPRAQLLGNLGIAQLIQTPTAQILKLSESLEACAMIIHTNPLQECLQPEGTPRFKGALPALERLCRELSLPVILKETGCGFSIETLRRLKEVGLAAVDVSGFGGTHWGRIEGDRNPEGDKRQIAAETFKNWGISTLESLLSAVELKSAREIWASGGVRSGLDAAVLLAMGASCVGFAKPMLSAAVKGAESLNREMERLEFELCTAMFCTGVSSIAELHTKRVWRWVKN